MSEKPILFSGEMIRAVLDGRKTQTRRVVKPQPVGLWAAPGKSRCPYGQPGGRLWVRETFYPERSHRGPVSYRATWPRDDDPPDGGWKPSIFMPRWASRITLEIVSVRVEQVQDISEDDARAEGVDDGTGQTRPLHPYWFRALWDSINSKRGYGWEKNPWVWVVAFRRVIP